MVSSGDKKNMAAYLREFYQVSLTRACKTLLFAKSMYYYRSVKDDREVIDKLLEGMIVKVVRCANAYDVASISPDFFDADQDVCL